MELFPIDNLHTTELGRIRIARNVGLTQGADVIKWARDKISGLPVDAFVHRGKNWYIYFDDIIVTINAHSFTIITAHKHNKS